MRISDWSSDVCSSDLRPLAQPVRLGEQRPRRRALRIVAQPRGAVGDEARIVALDVRYRAREHGRVARIGLEREPRREHRAIGGRHERELALRGTGRALRSEEHTSELQSLMRISYAVFCLKKKKKHT